MADEFDAVTTQDMTAVETPVEAKKQRKPRAKKEALDAAAGDAAGEPVVAPANGVEKQKRGRRTNSLDNAGAAKRVPVKRPPKAVQATPVVQTTPGDEISDLLQLEEENQRLRKLLAEKLRAENADLRKRLKLD